jgi:hypothetical protein
MITIGEINRQLSDIKINSFSPKDFPIYPNFLVWVRETKDSKSAFILFKRNDQNYSVGVKIHYYGNGNKNWKKELVESVKKAIIAIDNDDLSEWSFGLNTPQEINIYPRNSGNKNA